MRVAPAYESCRRVPDDGVANGTQQGLSEGSGSPAAGDYEIGVRVVDFL